MVEVTKYDTNNQFSWTEKTQTFDDVTGQLTQDYVLLDNGISILTILNSDVGNKSWLTDSAVDGGLFSWSEKQSNYDVNGDLVSVGLTYDNGVTKYELYEDGILRSAASVDGEENAEIWTRFDLMYGLDGQLVTKIIQFDDGIVRVQNFAEGSRTSTFDYDNPNDAGTGIKSWDRIETYYDQAGAVSERATYNDNGVLRVDSYTNGVRSQVFQFDNPNEENGGVKSWDRIEAYYDEGGNLSESATFYDNGIVRVTSYQAGQRASIVQLDNPNEVDSGVKVWDRIETYFDDAGQKSEQATVYDNGIIKVQQYTEGQLTQLLQYDEADAASWDRIETTFSRSAGSVTKTTLTVGDDGVERVDVREDGKRASLVEIDASADGTARKWETNARQYDEAGQLAQQRITFDNTDQFVFLYADRAKTQKVEFDGDDSNAWVYRVTDYTADGPVVTTYDPGDAATPPEIIALFDDLGF